jgi:hypothetical protein
MSNNPISIDSLVICVDDRFPPQASDWLSEYPVKGRIYSVKRLVNAPHFISGVFGPCLVLNELNNPMPNGSQGSFFAYRFKLYEEELEFENENRCLVTAPVSV